MIIHPRGELEKMPKILAQDLKPGFLDIEPGDILTICAPVERGKSVWLDYLVLERYPNMILTRFVMKECFAYAELAVLHHNGRLRITKGTRHG